MSADGIPVSGQVGAAGRAAPRRAGGAVDAAWGAAVAEAWRALLVSRGIVVAAGMLGALLLRPWDGRARAFDPGGAIPADGAAGVLVAPFARWDSVWLLDIAADGYGDDPLRPAFFPLYPLLVRGLGALLGTPVLAGVLLSLGACLVALVLLHRLAELEAGREAARTATWALALFPASAYLSAVYAEALFLALALGAVLAARTRSWVLAGILGGLAAATRSVGVLLLVPLVLLWLADTPRRPRSLGGLALVPLGAAAFPVWLAARGRGPLAFAEAQEWWERQAAWPWEGLRRGLAEGWNALGGLWPGGPADPLATQQVLLAGFLVLALVAVVGCARRLPPAYAAYLLAGLVAALAAPAAWQPLLSLPRFLLVLFPLFLWLGVRFGPRPGARRALYAVSATGLAAWSALFGAWTWLA